ncbi:MAG: hypothetical protein PHN49_06970 [Candidatus Omnitrophica bacterium]|nr:hypothetical protein [Candidatus Omnitrophota bacterium]MDD5671361.1 hypothetical protein [Candidatus Omnitrophota bacterium]
MKTPDKLQTILILCFLTGVSTVSPGCVQLPKRFPEIKTYVLDLKAGEHKPYTGTPVSIRLKPFTALPEFSDRYLIYRTTETNYESDFYNQLMTSPAAMVKEQAERWLKSSPWVRFIADTDFAASPHYVLNGKLLEFYGDYRRDSEPAAVLNLEWTVSHVRGGKTTILFQKIYSQSVPLPAISPRALVEGWGAGFGRIMADFEADFEQRLAKSSETPPAV